MVRGVPVSPCSSLIPHRAQESLNQSRLKVEVEEKLHDFMDGCSYLEPPEDVSAGGSPFPAGRNLYDLLEHLDASSVIQHTQ